MKGKSKVNLLLVFSRIREHLMFFNSELPNIYCATMYNRGRKELFLLKELKHPEHYIKNIMSKPSMFS